MLPTRARLALLALAHTTRVLGDAGLCLLLVPAVGSEALAAGLLLGPFVLLAPLTGGLADALSRRTVLVVAALLGPLGVGLGLLGFPWTVALGAIGVGAALYFAAGVALLPAAAHDGGMHLPRLVGLLHALCAGAVLIVVLFLVPPAPGTVPALLGVQILAALAALATAFPSDWPRSSSPRALLTAFWIDLGRTATMPSARAFLLGTTACLLLVVAGSLPLLGDPAWLAGGLVVGGLLAARQWNPWRNPGLVPLGGFGLFVALGLTWLRGPGPTLAALFGGAAGLGVAPLLAAYLAALPADARGNGAALLGALVALTLPLVLLAPGPGVLALLALVLALLGGYWMFPRFFQQLLDVATWYLSRVRVTGPGAATIPLDGPLVIVCNHSAYFDPVWVYKVTPRQMIAMMTSVFYDLPGVRWFFAHGTRAIRVPATTFRREAPELQEAIRVLQAGGCVLVFPEARLRKTEEKLLYPFGQGLWHILNAVPQTRIVTIWIEGGWGSWTSYAGGMPPFKGKPVDRRRKIDLGIAPPLTVDPALLADREAFRLWLMERVLACRAYLGLPVPTVAQATGRDLGAESRDPHQNDAEIAGER